MDGIDQVKCENNDGSYVSSGKCKDPGVCVPATGACCTSDGQCHDNLAADKCESIEGLFSPGAKCKDPGSCQDQLVACCLINPIGVISAVALGL